AGMLRRLRWFGASGWRGHLASDEPDAMSSPICATAPEVLERRRRKVRQRGKGFGSLAPRERHKLRIAVKKLRYTIELFGSLFDNDGVERFVGRLKRLQSDLGYANDVRVAHEFVTELLAQLDSAGLGKITTEIREAPPFYFAEGYHQQYLAKNPNGYCGLGGTGVACPMPATIAAD